MGNHNKTYSVAEDNIPACLGPRHTHAPVTFALPDGAWDTHFHLFDPLRAPYAPNRKYTPPPAPIDVYLALMERLGIGRAMLVHANLQGTDNRPLLEALAQGGGRFTGVVCMPEEADAALLREFHRAGVRGIRFAFNPQHGGSFDRAGFRRAEAWCARMGWFVELHFAADALPELMLALSAAQCPVVIDHMGRVDLREGTQGVHYRLLAELAGYDHVWIKLSGADRLCGPGTPLSAAVPVARDLVGIAPHRMLWGSDWPHTGVFRDMPDDGDLLNLMKDFVPDRVTRDRILADNPLRLIGERSGP
ncbi:amidohydrolase family protein [Pelagibacterium mangrovi]|uniref:amidohydrolase family protein n=1 Tax=Pelagibacterium mangrovi TaxID=3119828 RepID=UPI002FCBF433